MRLLGAMAAMSMMVMGCGSGPDEEDRPTVPLLKGPARGAYQGSVMRSETLRPELRWAAATSLSVRPVEYELELSTDATFTSKVETVETTELTHTPKDPLVVQAQPPVGARYYWRVRACISDLCSEYSATSWINVGRDPRDFNGDGFSDVLVGAPSGGAAFLYYGAATGLDAAPDLSLRSSGGSFGTSVAFAGDVNGDGFADVIVGDPLADLPRVNDAGSAYVYFGGTNPGANGNPDGILDGVANGDQFGASVSSAGDVNGDGFSDLLVGAPGAEEDEGRAYLYLGGAAASLDAVADQRFLSVGSRELGASVSGAGDLDADGFGDLAIGEPSRGNATLYFGAAVPGAAGGREPAQLRGQTGFGALMSAAGDLNRDGFADLLVGGAGSAQVLFGNDKSFFDVASDGIITGVGAMAGVGDVDGDGFGDVLVGQSIEGSASIYLGAEGARFSGELSNRRLINGVAAELFGSSVAAAGDVDGDGRVDLIIGAPNMFGIGKAYFFRGGNGGFVAGATLQGLANSSFGASVGSLNPPMP